MKWRFTPVLHIDHFKKYPWDRQRRLLIHVNSERLRPQKIENFSESETEREIELAGRVSLVQCREVVLRKRGQALFLTDLGELWPRVSQSGAPL